MDFGGEFFIVCGHGRFMPNQPENVHSVHKAVPSFTVTVLTEDKRIDLFPFYAYVAVIASLCFDAQGLVAEAHMPWEPNAVVFISCNLKSSACVTCGASEIAAFYRRMVASASPLPPDFEYVMHSESCQVLRCQIEIGKCEWVLKTFSQSPDRLRDATCEDLLQLRRRLDEVRCLNLLRISDFGPSYLKAVTTRAVQHTRAYAALAKLSLDPQSWILTMPWDLAHIIFSFICGVSISWKLAQEMRTCFKKL